MCIQLQILEKQGGRELDLSRGGAQDFRRAGRQRAEVDAVRRGLDLRQRQAVRATSELVAVRTAKRWCQALLRVAPLAAVRKYIQQQEEHHKRISFKDELISLLRKHRIEFDEGDLLD